MDLDKAIEFTNERLNSLSVDTGYTERENEIIKQTIEYLAFYTERENEIIKQTIEYLAFVKVVLTNMKGKENKGE